MIKVYLSVSFCIHSLDLDVHPCVSFGIAAAGVTTAIMWRVLNTETMADGPVVVTTRARAAAALAILFWLSAIIAGRMIAYTLQPGPF